MGNLENSKNNQQELRELVDRRAVAKNQRLKDELDKAIAFVKSEIFSKFK